jgi:hypothetical protein
MFRLITISVIALRVILCPLFCAVGNGDARAFGDEAAVTCTCATHHNEACDTDESSVPRPFDSPCDCPIPCESGCVCQVAPELNSRSIVEIELSFDFLPVSVDTWEVSEDSAAQREEHPHRHDRLSGRSIRLAFASLLL